MTRRPMLFGVLVAAAACLSSNGGLPTEDDDGWFDDLPAWNDEGGSKDSGEDDDDDSGVIVDYPDTGTGPDDDMVVEVTWFDDRVELRVSGCPDCRLAGLVETGSCEGTEYGCWTGEDCIYGYDAPDGSTFGPYCHPLSGSRLILEYGAAVDDVVEGSTTAFPSAEYAGQATFFVETSSGHCFVGGDDPSYYNGLGCERGEFLVSVP